MGSVSFITVNENGIITASFWGEIDRDLPTQFTGQKRIVIPNSAKVQAGDKTGFYEGNWKRKPENQLIIEGLLPVPKGFVLEGGGRLRSNVTLREMTQVERIEAGLEELPQGMRIEDGELVAMTDTELLEAGKITQEEYNERLAGQNMARLDTELGVFFTPTAMAQAEIDECYAKQRREKLAVLLAVREQPGWPLEAVWPE